MEIPLPEIRGVKALFQLAKSEVNWTYSNKDSAALLAETDTEIAKSSFSLQFSDAIEVCFQASQDHLRLRIFMLLMPASLFVYLMFLATDRLMFPDVFWLSVVLKTTVTLPLTLVCGFLALHYPAKINLLVVFISILVQLQVLCIMFLSESVYGWSLIYALALMCVITNAAYALDFRYAVFMAVQTIGQLLLIVMLKEDSSRVTSTFGLGVCACFCMYSLIAAYRIELSQRGAYILGLREKLRADALKIANSHLIQQVTVDSLTGLYNRRYFDERLSALWEEHQNAEASLGLLVIDIDHFKMLNDAHGHLVGDCCLQQVAKAMAEVIRTDSDILARFGGEEFAILLPTSDLERSFEVAERLRQRVELLHIHVENTPDPICVTVSIGCHAIIPKDGKQARKFLADADAALYDAKKGGRNMVSTQLMKQSLADAEMRCIGRHKITGTL